jgi:hypothetical protein
VARGLGSFASRSELWLGTVPTAGRTVALPAGADLIGIEWTARADARPMLGVRGPDGRVSRWVAATGCASGPRDANSARLVGSPVWVSGARTLLLHSDHPLEDVRLHIIDVSGGLGERRLTLARTVLGFTSGISPGAVLPAVGAGQPPILARATWGQGMAAPRAAPAYGAVRMAFVHHTQTPNGYLAGEVPAMLRAIFIYHRDVRGWNDIGYNFVLDAFGRIFEARAGGIDEPVVGAHAGGFNLESTGVAILGEFAGARIPGTAANALQALLAWKLSLHGVPLRGRVLVRVNPAGAVYSRFPAGAHVSLPRIAGHRDGDSTDCPGDALYGQLPQVRAAAQKLAPAAALATLVLVRSPPQPAPPAQPTSPAQPAPPAPPAPAGAPGAQPEAQLTGRLTLLDGTPLKGARVELQLRGMARRGKAALERTLAVVSTDATGSWSLSVSALPAVPAQARGFAWLRALYVGGGGQPALSRAAVSDPLRVPAALTRLLEASAPTPSAPAPPVP